MTLAAARPASIALVLVVGLLAAATARAAPPPREQLQKRAEQERQKLGYWDNPGKYEALYPAPELQLGTVATGCAGETVTVVLEGKVAEGTTFLVEESEAELVATRPVARGVELRLKVRPDAVAAVVNVAIIAPVTLAEQSLPVLAVACRFDVDVELANGGSGRIRSVSKSAEAIVFRSEWFRAGAKKPFHTQGLELSVGSSSLRFTYTLEEQEAMANAMGGLMGAISDEGTAKELERLGAEMEACMDKRNASQQACLEKYGEGAEALQKKQMDRMNTATKADPALTRQMVFGCESFSLVRGESGLEGLLNGCKDTSGALDVVKVSVKPGK